MPDPVLPRGAEGPTRGRAEATREDSGARLLWFLLVFGGSTVALIAVVGVVMGMVGGFRAVPLLAASVIGGLVVTSRSWRDLPGGGRPDLAAIATLVLVVVVVGSNAHYAGEHVLVDRDPGVYLTAGLSLADSGELRVATDNAAFGPDAWVYFSSGGYSQVEGGDELQPWFLHGVVAVIAVAADLGGPAAAVRVPAALSGLAVLALVVLARRFVGGWSALLGGVVLAGCLVQIWAFRDTYSETLGQPLLWGGLALVLLARDRRSRAVAAAGGILLAGATLSRLDSPPLLLVVAVLWVLADDRRDRQVVGAVLVPLLVGFGVWGLQLSVVNPVYVTAHRAEVLLLVAGSVLGSVVLVALRRPVRAVVANPAARRTLGRVAALGVVAVVAAGLTRPLWGEVRRSTPWPEAQAVEVVSGVDATGLRTYAEQTMRWMGWYLGWPGLALATLGGGWAALRSATDRRFGRAALVVASASVPLTLLYLWNPRAVPDHLWVMRRFLIVTIPVLALATAVGADAAHRAVRHATMRWRPGAARTLGGATAALVAVVVLVGEWGTTAPMARLSMMDGNVHLVEQVCDALPDDASVVVVAPAGTNDTLGAGVRALCGVPVGVLRGQAPETLARSLVSIEQVGRSPVVIGADRDLLEAVLPGVTLPPPLLATNDRHPELNVQKPRNLYTSRVEITVVVVA